MNPFFVVVDVVVVVVVVRDKVVKGRQEFIFELNLFIISYCQN